MTTKKPVSWNLTHLRACDDDPRIQQEFDEIRVSYSRFAEKWQANTSYLTSVDSLLEALVELEMLTETYGAIGKSGYYWILRGVQQQNHAKVKQMQAVTFALDSDISNKIEFFTNTLGRVPPSQQEVFIKSSKLAQYRHFLEKLFVQARYVLSEPEEKILAKLQQSAWDKWIALRSVFLSNETAKVLTETGVVETKMLEELMSLVQSKHEKVRKSAGKAINKILKRNALLAEHELNAILLTKKMVDEIRKLPRPDSAQHLEDDIESETVDVLIATVSSHFDLPQRYYRLKAALLGKKQLEYYERAVEYGELSATYSFEEAIKIVSKVFNNLDSQFAELFNRFVTDGLIDPFPSVGKAHGAACFGGTKLLPVYQYMNFTGRLRDILTLAHESGHAINDELSKVQHSLDYGTSKATAEVASTFMEDFVLEYVARNLTDKDKLSLYIARLDDQVATIFRQTALYNFETELHKTFRDKLYLTHEEIGKLFVKHMKSYMGESINFAKGAKNWWVDWPHIRIPFYVYSYVGGLLISMSLQSRVRGDRKFIERVKVFLSAGVSKSPKDIFSDMGIDITKQVFWENGISEFEKLLTGAENLAKTLKLP